MRLRSVLVSFLILFCCLSANAAGNPSRSLYLKAPAVSWNGNRLSGKLENIPIGKLLEDLIKGGDFDCDVSGQLNGNISVRFENLTVEEFIRKIMRNKNFNYTILSSPSASETKEYSGIRKLTIYQGDDTISFTRVPHRFNKQKATVKAIRTPTRATPQKPAAGKRPQSAGNIAEDKKKLDQEINQLMEDMLKSKKISPEEYEKAKDDIKADKKE